MTPSYPFATILSKPGDIATAAYNGIIQCLAILLASMARLPNEFLPSFSTAPDGSDITKIPACKATFINTLHLRNDKKTEPLEYVLLNTPGEKAAVNIIYRWHKAQYIISAQDVPYDSLVALAQHMYNRLHGLWPLDEPDPDTAAKTWSCDVIFPLSLHLENIPADTMEEAEEKARNIALYTDLCDWGDDFSNAEVNNIEEQ